MILVTYAVTEAEIKIKMFHKFDHLFCLVRCESVAVRVHLVRVQVQQIFNHQETCGDLPREEEPLLVQGVPLCW